jgi:hypothetical protein
MAVLEHAGELGQEIVEQDGLQEIVGGAGAERSLRNHGARGGVVDAIRRRPGRIAPSED